MTVTNLPLTKEQAEKIAQDHNLLDEKVVVLGYRNKEQKRNIYEDCIAIFDLEKGQLTCYDGNTDPSVFRPGIAVLQPGVYDYKRGIHGLDHLKLPEEQQILDRMVVYQQDPPPDPSRLLPYWALRQAGPVTLLRDGKSETETEKDPQHFPFIDIHRGGWNTTSSLGCQTIYPQQWPHFRDTIFGLLALYKKEIVKYCLTLQQ